MDLESGYWQIPMKKEEKEKTAFTTADGSCRFLVMPFDLCTAQSIFQRTMNTVLGGLRWTSCLVYLDDIIVYAGDTKEHIRRLRLVLAALRKANLKLKLVKCRFGESAIIALGHKINADGISPDPGKVRAVQNFPTPPTIASRAEKVNEQNYSITEKECLALICVIKRSPTPATQAGDTWKSYQEAAVTAAAIENGIRLFIHIPIFEFTRALTLYRVIGMARATKNGSTSLKYVGLPQYLAKSPDQQTFIELSAEMVGPCCPTKKSICPISRVVSQKNNKGTCSIAIFLADNQRIQDDCTVVVSPWTGQDAVYLGHRRMGLSAVNTTRLVVTCPRQTTRPQSYTLDTPAISIFEIPMSCTAQSDDWIFQASFRKDTHQKWITRTTPHLADLKAPGRPPQRPLITAKDDIVTQQTGLHTGSPNNRLRDLKTGMVHQMDGLSDLEHARLNIDDTQNYLRYPWEWIAILILCMLV
ncbi:uncharacterized protein LOC116934113 [Daphnia magna]|uniref:uncharacterized protein LOC116934113 n=1 Tax=Daphnia magna TaxID=35525 RepID=UPI001E1BDE30|nr:uncharacterized protein LOC116934113 [Daphnia magna]